MMPVASGVIAVFDPGKIAVKPVRLSFLGFRSFVLVASGSDPTDMPEDKQLNFENAQDDAMTWKVLDPQARVLALSK